MTDKPNERSYEGVEAFYGGPFDGVRPPWSAHRSEQHGVVDPVGGAFYERAPQLDKPGERAWKHVPEKNFKPGTAAHAELHDVAPDSLAPLDKMPERPAPSSLSTMSVQAESKEHPVTLGQLRALGERAVEMGFPDDTPIRALVFMRGTVKALEVRAPK